MRFRTIGVIMLCALLALTRAQGSSDEEADENFNTEALLDSNITLYCNDSTLQEDFTFDYWILPDISVMLKGEADVFRILDGEASWEVSHDGMELRVVHLQERQFGAYFCVGKLDDGTSASRVVVVKRGLNVNGPYFGDLWQEYRLNTIIGLSAAGGYLLVFAILYGTYHLRYRSGKEEDEAEEEAEEERGNNIEMLDLQAIETVAVTDGTGYENEVFPRTRTSSGSTPDEEQYRF